MTAPDDFDSADLDGLPETYALALRLRAEGLDDDAIGRVLAIETASVPPLMDLAESKLAGLHDESGGDGGTGGTAGNEGGGPGTSL
jgi:hypothetical protein